MNRSFSILLHKIKNPEYWPTWIIYAQAFFYVAYHTLKLGNKFYPVVINPAIGSNGGFAGVNKNDLHALFPAELQPVTRTWYANEGIDTIAETVNAEIHFPCFVKPTNLFRGIGVEKIETPTDLVSFLKGRTSPVLIQECIQLPQEFGVFITKIPGNPLRITGLTGKIFLTVTGNGKSTIQELLLQNVRYHLSRKHIDPLWSHRMHEIPQKDETLLIQPVGNHNRGTIFKDMSRYITKEMEALFQSIVPEGVYYGRFDVKALNFESLETGKDLYIIEFNGSIAEPVTYLDPNYSYFKGQRIILNHFNIQRQIGEALINCGAMAPGLLSGIRIILKANQFEKEKSFTFARKKE